MQELCFPFSICEEECSICEFQEKQPLRRIALSLIKKFKKAVSHCLCLTKGIAAMITNTRIDKYTDPSSKIWNATTSAGATIKPALDFATTLSTSTSGEAKYAPELYPNIAAVASVYGDADGKYNKFLRAAEPQFMSEPYILWNQPFALDESSGRVQGSTIISSVSTKSLPAPAGLEVFGLVLQLKQSQCAIYSSSDWISN
ncbi:hypothetical protein BDZ97DRAFT_1922414 [Flammula alnicola]|nr:hypothetical protein BDZ97DRAFT_1922414 [Flammula alnicola]